MREALDLLSELIFIAAALTIVVFAWPVIRDLWDFDQRSQSADVPLVIPQAMIPIGLRSWRCWSLSRLITGGDRDAIRTPGH